MESSAAAGQSTIRRVLSGVGDDGKAVIAIDERMAPQRANPSPGFELWRVKLPIELPLEPEIIPWDGFFPEPGEVYVKVTEVPPASTGLEIPMHRTDSVDISFVLSGEITLIMDGGDETTLRQGDFFVQLGTNHTWENRGDEPCRVGFVFLGATRREGT